MKALLIGIALVFVSGCQRGCTKTHSEMSPEEVVEAYLDASLQVSSLEEKEKIMSFTTGNLKRTIAQSSDEEFRESYIDREIVLEAYSVVQSRQRTPRETEITYELKFKNLLEAEVSPDGEYVFDDAGNKKFKKYQKDEAAIISSENTVSVVRENRLWLIRDVIGNKFAMEFPLTDTSVIAGPCKNPTTDDAEECE